MKKFSHWKFLADLNISLKTVLFLQTLGCDIKRIDKSLSQDEDVIQLAKTEKRIILTFDKDFGEIYYFRERGKITVIVLYLEDQTSESMNRTMKALLNDVSEEKIKHKLTILQQGRLRMIT